MSNRLARETSPYLQQHADNPVDWYPWGDEALAAARQQDKPILLSIGYSACHWCHVMAHECFEDAEVAAVMNKYFINVKVDREERPDLDQIYQTAHQVLNSRRGGWPLTMFLTADQTPFFGGTYFPKTPKLEKPGMLDLLPQLATMYRDDRADIEQRGKALVAGLARTQPSAATAGELTQATLKAVLDELKRRFDTVDGGLDEPLKFPHPAEMEFALRAAVSGNDESLLALVTSTLAIMAGRGLYDQLGGGFYRYCVDKQWVIPHFEKMLYDNGPLLRLFSDIWLVDKSPLFERAVANTAGWVMHEMQSPQGGYYSTLDADSEHEEGKYYIWTPPQVKALVTADEYAAAALHYGLDAPPNFEETHWHLQAVVPVADVARRLALSPARVDALLDSTRSKLMLNRAQRVRPARDEKILTAWNALTIKGMTHAARVFDKPQWLASARNALEFIRTNLWRDGRLLASFKDGKAQFNGYLDDYAFLLDALLELMQADFRPRDLAWACELADALLAKFEDRENGGFFFVSHDHEQLLQRVKIGARNDTPSGNSVAAVALDRLGHILGEPRYSEAAHRTVKVFRQLLEEQPNAHGMLGIALEEQLAPPTIVVLTGAGDARAWQRAIDARYLPHVLTLAIPAGLTKLPDMLAKPAGGGLKAWVCQGVSCLPPISDTAALLEVVSARE
ncbi:MAG: thioredoxin protein [Betaproteobacteria bacterium]|nr:thioredoxin protein [Betaproteobacteria bacterium]